MSGEPTVDELYRAIEDSHKSLSKIGEGDWSPQDSAHAWLLATLEQLLMSGRLQPRPPSISKPP